MTSESPDDVRVSFSQHPGEAPSPLLRGLSDRVFEIVIVSDAGADKAGCISIDKDNFKTVMEAVSPRIEVELSGLAAAGDKLKTVPVKFPSLSDLEPAGLAAQIPAAAARLRARELLLDAEISPERLREQVSILASEDRNLSWLSTMLNGGGPEAPPAVPASAPSAAGQSKTSPPAGGSLLDMVDVDKSAPGTAPTPASMLDPLFKAISRSVSKGGPNVAKRRQAVERLEQELNSILNQAYSAPPVRRMERTWRGLKFLVDRIDFRKNIKLSLLSSSGENVILRVRQTIVDPVHSGLNDAPSLIVLDREYSASHADVEELSELAQLAASLPCVTITNAALGFLGIERSADLGKLPNLRSHGQSPPFIKWNAFRSEPYSRFLGVVLGRFLLRPAFARSEPPKESYEFIEQPESSEAQCWAGGALAMAALAANSFAKFGWATRFTGTSNGRLEYLPLREYATGLGHKKHVSGDFIVPDKRIEEFPLLGMNCLTAVPDKDMVVLCNGVSAHTPPTYQDVPDIVGWLEVSLPYQFFTCQISNLLYSLKQGLDKGGSDQDIAARVVVPLAAAMGVGEQAPNYVQARALPPEQVGQSGTLEVTVTAPNHILPGGLEVTLALPFS